jgi:hypothetical protein
MVVPMSPSAELDIPGLSWPNGMGFGRSGSTVYKYHDCA